MPSVKAKFEAADTQYGGGSAWDAFEKLVALAGLVIELISQSTYVIGMMLNQPAGKTIVGLCLLDPLVRVFWYRRWKSGTFRQIGYSA